MRFGSGEFNAASSVQQTSDGGYIIAGSSGVIGSSSVLVAKLSTAGGYIVGGEVVAESPEGTTPGEALLLKLSSAGAIRFQDVFNAGTALNFSSHGTSIRQTGRRLHPRRVRGPLAEHGTPAVASWLVKTTSTGALSWQHIFYGPSDFSDFQSVRLTGDGGYIAAGVTGDFADADNFWLVKTDSNGNVANGSCKDQHGGTTIEQAGGLTATTTSFPTMTPPSNPPAATTDAPGTTTLVAEPVC